MDFVKEMKAKAIQYQNRLVLPEGTEERTVAAAAQIVAEKLAKTVTLLGEKSEIEKIAAAKGVSLDGIEIIDPKKSDYAEEFANAFYELRKHKGITTLMYDFDPMKEDYVDFGYEIIQCEFGWYASPLKKEMKSFDDVPDYFDY